MIDEKTSGERKRRKHNSHKTSSLTGKGLVLSMVVLVMIGGILFAAPSTAMAQQQQATTAPTTEPLTPEEQREQDRLQNVTSAITRNLQQGEKQINGIVYTPRWSDPVWVQPSSLSMLFVYCLPGEYAESGQQILGGPELQVLESYSVAVTKDLSGWLMIVRNGHQADRLPAAVGVICSSDADDLEARHLSEQEQIQINNVIKQFLTVRNTVINNITQIINIINNVTNNSTGGVTPPPTNQTGGNQTGGGANTLRVSISSEPLDSFDAPADFEFDSNVEGGSPPYIVHWYFDDGTEASNAHAFVHRFWWPGNYTVVVTATDPFGRTGIAHENLVIEEGPDTPQQWMDVEITRDVADLSPVPATITFHAQVTGGYAPYTYSWSVNNEQIDETSDTLTHTFENAETYDVRVLVTDATGTMHSELVTVRLNPCYPPEGVTPVCEEEVPTTTTNETEAVTPPTTTTTNETEAVTPPATTEGETTTTPPTTEGGGGATTTDTTPETPPATTEGGGAATEESPAGTTTEGEGTATIPGT